MSNSTVPGLLQPPDRESAGKKPRAEAATQTGAQLLQKEVTERKYSAEADGRRTLCLPDGGWAGRNNHDGEL